MSREWLRGDKFGEIPLELSPLYFNLDYYRRTSQEGEVDKFEERFITEDIAKQFIKFIRDYDAYDFKLLKVEIIITEIKLE